MSPEEAPLKASFKTGCATSTEYEAPVKLAGKGMIASELMFSNDGANLRGWIMVSTGNRVGWTGSGSADSAVAPSDNWCLSLITGRGFPEVGTVPIFTAVSGATTGSGAAAGAGPDRIILHITHCGIEVPLI